MSRPGHAATAPVAVIDDVSFTVAAGECVVLFGPNGCGKTTLLDVIAGRIAPTSGRLLHRAGPALSYVFQRHAETLLPWRTVAGNVALPLEARGVPRAARAARVEAMLTQVGLREVATSPLYRLSGGQLQRLAIARALIEPPALLLLDEPFANVDHVTALAMAVATRAQALATGAGVCAVTHDPDLAVLLADRIVVLSPRPARVVTTLSVPLPPVRTTRDGATPAASRVRAALLDAVAGATWATDDAPVRDVPPVERARA